MPPHATQKSREITPVYTNTYFIASDIESYGVPVFSFSIPDSEIIGSNGFYSNFMPTGNITATRPRGLGVLEVYDENGGRVGVSNVEMAVSRNGLHDSYELRQVSFSGKIIDVSVGYDHMLIIDENGTLWGVGSNSYGQLGAAGEGGSLYYSGRRDYTSYQLGNGNDPTMIKVTEGVLKAASYFDNMVILTKEGEALVYGLNAKNAIGKNVVGRAPEKLLDGVVDIASGYGFSAFLTEDGTIIVQGDNSLGQAGIGETSDSVTLSEIEIG